MTDRPHRSVFTAARVANESLDDWLPDHAVVVEDERIETVVPKNALPSDIAETAQVYELGDVSLLPGLVDAHCHMHCSATPDARRLAMTEDVQRLTMRAVTAMRKALLAGTTTLRDVGSPNEVAFPVREAVRSGAIPGPRMLVAGTPITITAGHCWFFGTEADTKEEVVTAVRRQVRLGADLIKIMATGGFFTPTANPYRPQYSADTLAAAVDEAERAGLPIVAHTLSADGVQNCVEAGIHTLVHARWFDRDPNAGDDYRPEVVKRMVDQGQSVDPTFGLRRVGEMAERRREVGDAPIVQTAATRRPADSHIELLARMDAAGVRLVSGLDMGMTRAHFDMAAANAWAFVELLGWSTWRAICTVTAGTAAGVRVGDIVGRIGPGMMADLAAFEGDPAEDIRRLDIASTVVQSGRPVKLNHRVLV